MTDMKRGNIFKKALVIIAALIIGLSGGFLGRELTEPKLVSANSVGDLNIITYDSGDVVLFYSAFDYPRSFPVTAVSLKVDKNNDVSPDRFSNRSIYHWGSNWQRSVSTLSLKNDDCVDGIIYVNRDPNEKAKIVLNKTEGCIVDFLDFHDFSRFFSISRDRQKIFVGDSKTGEQYWGIDLGAPDQTIGFIAANWETDKLIFSTGSCDRGSGNLKYYLADTDYDRAIDITDYLPIETCGQIEQVVYNRALKTFDFQFRNSAGNVQTYSVSEDFN